MYCKRCGSQITDDAIFCSKCGCKVENVETASQSSQTNTVYDSNSANVITPHTLPASNTTLAEPKQTPPRKNTGTQGTAKGFLVLACVVVAILSIFFLLLYIMIRNIIYTDPEMIEYYYGYDTLILYILCILLVFFVVSLLMTTHYFHATKDGVPVSTAFKICTLIFVSFIAGIIMLCDKDEG